MDEPSRDRGMYESREELSHNGEMGDAVAEAENVRPDLKRPLLEQGIEISPSQPLKRTKTEKELYPLCDVCYRAMTLHGTPPLGTLDELRKRKDCHSCQTFVDAITDLNLDLGSNYAAFLSYQGRESNLVLTMVHPVDPGDFTILYDLSASLLWRIFDPNFLDVGIVREWINQCSGLHGDNCNVPRLPPANHQIFLIDLENECIVEESFSAAYLALSYVWGGVEMFQTTRENVKSLMQPGSLGANSDKILPNTIRDAMMLTLDLGFRYLWTDCLCIVQDDEELKSIHLNSMASIYAHAYLTIVAAQGTDANYGLPGVKGGSRRRNIRCHTVHSPNGQELVLRRRRPIWPDGTSWNSRGWTYQEYLFSRRVLIIDDLASWHCSCRHLEEDKQIGDPNSHFTNPDFINPATQPDASTFPLRTWARLIKPFNRRLLKYDEDVLAAFAGVTSVMNRHLKEGFHYGIPIQYFESGLLWKPRRHLNQRIASSLATNISASWNVQQHLAQRKPSLVANASELPSWSWIGWQGELDFSLWYEYDRGRLASIDGQVVFIPSEFSYPPVIERNKLNCCNERSQCPHLSINTTQLILRCGKHFKVHRDFTGFRLTNSSGIEVGFIYGPDSSVELEFLSRHALEDCELIAISSGLYGNSYLQQFLPMEIERPDSQVEMYNVLWIKWQDGIAFRRALGTVYRSAWECSSLRQVEVKLG